MDPVTIALVGGAAWAWYKKRAQTQALATADVTTQAIAAQRAAWLTEQAGALDAAHGQWLAERAGQDADDAALMQLLHQAGLPTDAHFVDVLSSGSTVLQNGWTAGGSAPDCFCTMVYPSTCTCGSGSGFPSGMVVELWRSPSRGDVFLLSKPDGWVKVSFTDPRKVRLDWPGLLLRDPIPALPVFTPTNPYRQPIPALPVYTPTQPSGGGWLSPISLDPSVGYPVEVIAPPAPVVLADGTTLYPVAPSPTPIKLTAPTVITVSDVPKVSSSGDVPVFEPGTVG